ncbi:hypothetical protein DV735_g3317, partial [Chaetothyriales sp. CBS 134920]
MNLYPDPPCWLVELPIEVQSLILQHLHWNSLAAFAQTSRCNYRLVRFTLSSLRISIFHKRVHGLLADINDDSDLLLDQREDPAWSRIVLPVHERPAVEMAAAEASTTTRCRKNRSLLAPPSVQRVRKIMKQNANLEQILCTPMLAELSSLTVNTYGLLSMTLAKAMAGNLSRLRQLTLNFSHPYIHDPLLPPRYWKTCPDVDAEGTPAWNALAGFGDQYLSALKMTGLQRLSITRAAITSAQLSKWVGVSRDLCELRLDMVSGVDNNFVEWLAGVQVKERDDRCTLRALSIRRCPGLHVRTVSDARWIQHLLKDKPGTAGSPLKLVQEDTLAEPEQEDNADSSRRNKLSMEGFNFGNRPLGVWKSDVA